MRANADLARLFDWAAAWVETKDIYYRDLIKSEVDIADDSDSYFRAICRAHLVEFPDDPHYQRIFLERVREWKAQYPKLVN